MKGGIIIAALAAFAYYKYSKLTPEQKRDLVNKLKGKGQKLYDDYVPAEPLNRINEVHCCIRAMHFFFRPVPETY